ncbi:MAG TPA: ectonucleotide pyrophosphatase/phosphodiesterase [Blastocatellia bacterium]|nr:ectonucleotide pyrophosphatase/phosphodiesterase [Blastocatellia bacterium]
MTKILLPFLWLLVMAPAGRARPVLVISVDGLDHRYLRDGDQLGLQIPNLRRLMREGELADGVVGVLPTVTWPSHTTLITGVAPAEHGILGNRRPQSEGGDYYWEVSLLKAKTLWHAAREAGLRTAAITWPVTVGAPIDFNLPEYFRRRQGGAMDLQSIAEKATPGLLEKITRHFPSFPQEWMDDRTRALATVYLLKHERPDLLLLHFVDLDAEAHHNGPFSREANAVLEYTDELIGRILAALPAEMAVALVSDHGFERADRVVNLNVLLAREGVKGKADVASGFVTARDKEVAAWLRQAARHGVGREIPKEELRRFAPRLAEVEAAFEPAPHHLFGPATSGEAFAKPAETGVHGLWPGRPDYLSSFILWGPGIKPARRPRMSMLEIAPRLASLMGVKFVVGGPSR